MPVDAATARCRVTANACALADGEAVTDDDVAPVGSTVTLRGRPLRVVAHTAKAASLLNRAVVFVTPAAFDRSDGSREPPFAAVAAGGPGRSALDAARAGERTPDELAVSSTAQIADANRRFWAGNGTPIMLILILLVMVFGGVAFYASREALHEQARAEIATLLAIGVPARARRRRARAHGDLGGRRRDHRRAAGGRDRGAGRLADPRLPCHRRARHGGGERRADGRGGIGALVGTGLRLRRANLAEAMAA